MLRPEERTALQWEGIQGLKETAVLIGRRVRELREKKALTLQVVAELTGRHHPQRRQITPGQISRIENGLVIPDLSELTLLCLALECNLGQLLVSDPKPWFVIRQAKSEQWLKEIEAGERTIKRQTERHIELIKKGTYRYVPLEDDTEAGGSDGLVAPNERAGIMNPAMRKNLLIVNRIDERDLKSCLDSHPGEEIIFVLKGELEFWYMKDSTAKALKPPLGPGDCLHFSSEMPHAFRATGTTEVRAFQVFGETTFGTRRDFYETGRDC